MGYLTDLFIESPGRDFSCAICLNVLQNPVGCEAGHVFCSQCLDEWRLRKNTCPSCRLTLSGNPTTNLTVTNQINAMMVRCEHSRWSLTTHDSFDTTESNPNRHSTEHCTWTGKLEDRETHLQSCYFQTIKCSMGCEAVMQRRAVEKHSCNRKRVKCACGLPVFRNDLPSHLFTCQKQLVVCPVVGCGVHLFRCDLDTHLSAAVLKHTHIPQHRI